MTPHALLPFIGCTRCLAASPFAVLMTLALCLGAVPAWAADVANGQRLYEARCATCHTLDENDVGPAHRGVYGRHPGAVPGFTYSDALKRKAASTWDDATLNAWLAAPERYAPGQAMGVSVAEPEARADLIAYLRSLSPPAR